MLDLEHLNERLHTMVLNAGAPPFRPWEVPDRAAAAQIWGRRRTRGRPHPPPPAKPL